MKPLKVILEQQLYLLNDFLLILISTKFDFSFSKIDNSFSQKLVLSSFCNPQFQLEIFIWETGIYKLTSIYNSHIITTLNYRFLDNDSPPPRLV